MDEEWCVCFWVEGLYFGVFRFRDVGFGSWVLRRFVFFLKISLVGFRLVYGFIFFKSVGCILGIMFWGGRLG